MQSPRFLRAGRARLFIAPVALAIGASASSASAVIVIDDFSDIEEPSQWPVVLDTLGSTMVEETGLSGVAGGSRVSTITADAFVDPGVDDVEVTVAASIGRLDFASTAGAEGSLGLLYDSQGAGLNLDFSGEEQIVLPFLLFDSANNAPMPVTVSVTDGSGTTASLTRMLTTPGAQFVIFEFDQFTRGITFDFADVDAIEIEFDAAMATDFRVGAISTVIPAPGALAVFGLGLLGARRRRRRG